MRRCGGCNGRLNAELPPEQFWAGQWWHRMCLIAAACAAPRDRPAPPPIARRTPAVPPVTTLRVRYRLAGHRRHGDMEYLIVVGRVSSEPQRHATEDRMWADGAEAVIVEAVPGNPGHFILEGRLPCTRREPQSGAPDHAQLP